MRACRRVLAMMLCALRVWCARTQVLDRRSKKKKGGKTAAVGNDSRVHSIGLSDSGEALELNHLRRAFCENAHEAKVLEARVNRIMGLLALLFFEDIPMMVLNLMVVSEFTTNPVAGRSSTPILLSMTIGNMMASGGGVFVRGGCRFVAVAGFVLDNSTATAATGGRMCPF